MITHDEYQLALVTVLKYHEQVRKDAVEIQAVTANKVKLARKYISGHRIDYFSYGKKYDIVKNPYRHGDMKHKYNEKSFGVIDNYGKLRKYRYSNLNGMWEFIKEELEKE